MEKIISINKQGLAPGKDWTDGAIRFTNGYKLESVHHSDCCESHYLSLGDLVLEELEHLEFDLTSGETALFERIPGYGIALLPKNGHPVRIPGYGDNNGYYNSSIDLVLSKDGEVVATFEVSECQDY